MRQWSKRREQIAEATDPCSGASLREAIRTPSLIVAPHTAARVERGGAGAFEKLAHSRTRRRGRSSARGSSGRRAGARRRRQIAAELHLTADTVRDWIKRFRRAAWWAGGPAPFGPPADLHARADRHRDRCRADQPQTLGLPFAAWTLDRLAAYLHEQKGIAMQRSRIDEILLHEGLRWRKHETWFGERVDPAFAEKRGGSKRSTPRRLRAVV